MSEQSSLSVHLVTPEREIWSGPATFVLARSAAGDVGILPDHEPTLSLLGIGAVKIERSAQDPLVAACDGGFLSISRVGDETRVNVLAENVTLQGDIDRHEIEELERRAEELRIAGDLENARIIAAQAATRRRIHH